MNENPYEAPENINDITNEEVTPGVRSISKFATWAKVMLILNVVLSVVMLIATHSSAYDDFMANAALGISDEGEFYKNLILLGSVIGGIFIITVVSVCIWINKAMKNTWSLGNTTPTMSSGWAVGWYFIPIANLWKPFGGMAQIWEGAVGPSYSKVLLHLWWWTWILSNILNRASRKMEVKDIEDASAIHSVETAAIVCSIIAATCLIKIIARVSAYHNSKVVA